MRFANCLLVAFVCVLLVSIGCSSSDDVTGPPPDRFVDNGNGTVTDTETGLIWLKNASCLGQENWDNARTAAAQLGEGTPGGTACGLTDGSTAGQWRLPSVECPSPSYCDLSTPPTGEFVAIFAPSCGAPYILNSAGTGCWTEGNPFSGIQSSNYWSSTSNAVNPDNAWYVSTHYGVVNSFLKSSSAHVWPVRDGQ